MLPDKFGRDEWAAQIDARRAGPSGLAGQILARWSAIPLAWRLIGLLAVAAIVPPLTANDYLIRIAGTICLFATLALGLNVVVGYAGLLDLGYVAFYGLGAYAYALLSSDKFNVHWPSWASLLFIGALSVGFGLLLGSPSLRLLGDYLAIVTLGFGLVFVQLSITLDRVQVPWEPNPIDITGGSNGLINLDQLEFLGFELTNVTHYFYVLLIWLAVALLVIYRMNQSRIGRAWRSMREDPLAAEAMGMPTKWLKLLAFAFGAAIAGVSGGIFAAWQGGVFPLNFGTDVLITIYAMVVLGGVGSLGGAVLGAGLLAFVPELLRSPELARVTFYAGLGLGILLLTRPRRTGLATLAGVIGFGLALRLVMHIIAPDFQAAPSISVAAASVSSGFERAAQSFGIAIQQWIIYPTNLTLPGNLAFLILIPSLMGLARMRSGRWKAALRIPLLYLLAFVWETRLSVEPAVTRLLLIGLMLVLLMIFRPQGLLGTKRVEIA